MRILLVDDNHRLNDSLASSLTPEGYSVDSAYNRQEGQDLAEMMPYDVIILDTLLPELLATVRGVGYRLQSPPERG